MQAHFQITVMDILKRKHFEDVEVIAGEAGIHRIVKWVHVVEVAKIKSLLKGNELILSTGVGWKEDLQLFMSFLYELIESEAAGLCIEMGMYTSSIPNEIIEIANQHEFPIVLFLNEVPFVEITQDIHSHVISQHYQLISNLEQYSQQLNKKLLTIQCYEEILTLLHQHLGHTVLFRMKGSEMQVLPCDINIPYEHIENMCENPHTRIAHQSIQLLGHNYAELYIYSEEEINEYDTLILDRTATAIAQHLLRDLYVEEKRRAEENEWVKGWIDGEHHIREIDGVISSYFIDKKPKGGVVCICKVQEGNLSTDLTYFKLLFRTIFEQIGFCILSTEKRNELTFVLLHNREMQNRKHRIKNGIDRLLNSEYMKKQKPAVTIGVGKFIEQLSDLSKSFTTAKETIRVQHTVMKVCHFYEDLHMYRLISMIHKNNDLQESIIEYLDPVIRYDRKYKGKLMETLRVYLACNGSKQETANRLFVVRQTLYHRITRLEQLLGSDFMTSEKRLVIEFMVQAYDYLLSTNQMKAYYYDNESSSTL